MPFWSRDDSPQSAPWFRLTLSVRAGRNKWRLRSPRRLGWVVVALVLLGGYALSPLPVLLTLRLFPQLSPSAIESALQVVYFPLILAMEYVPGVEAFYDWYIAWGESVTGRSL